ncbi:MAG: prepilin-type N-terminal cleavage/methylation domain-containing protein [Candidatus Babeliales bacterium]
MIRFKNRDGFSLIELIIAIAIMSTTLIALFGSQSGSLRSVLRRHQTFLRLYLIKNQLREYEMQPLSQDPIKIIEKETSHPKTMLRYTIKNVPLESSLAPLKNIYLGQASGSWRVMRIPFDEQFVTVLFAPKQEKKQ